MRVRAKLGPQQGLRLKLSCSLSFPVQFSEEGRDETLEATAILREAIEIDPRKSDAVPSTKGVLGS